MNTGHVFLASGADALPGGSSQDSGPTATAWRQELRRAFVRGWFHGPMDPGEGRSVGVAAQVRARAQVPVAECGRRPDSGWSEVRTPEGFPPGQVQSTAQSQAEATRIQANAAGQRSVPELRVRAEAMHARVTEPDSGEGGIRRAGIPLRTAAAEHHDALRIHVEHGQEGSTVWIGMDGEASFVGSQAQAIVAELARLVQGTPCRLAAVICNGVLVYGGGASSVTTTRKESPWP